MTQHKAAIYKSESEINERGKITLQMKVYIKLTPLFTNLSISFEATYF